MSSSPSAAAAKKKPQGSKVEKEEVVARSYSVIEVDPALEDPMLLEIISDAPWYIASSVSQHMTGDLHLLTDFVTIRPSHTVQTHTGARLQVCGKGSVKTGQFNIPNVSYVPGLSENIISVSQLTDTGFTVIFGADGFTVKKSGDETKVGSGSYGGNQLFTWILS